MDGDGQVRGCAGVQRHDGAGDDSGCSLAAADDGDDAGSVGEPDGGNGGVAGRDLQGQRQLLSRGDVDAGTAGGRRDLWGQRGGGVRDRGGAGEHVDALGGDVRRVDAAAVREWGAGFEPGADGGDHDVDESPAGRGRQHLWASVSGDDRRGAGLQRGVDGGPGPDGHGGADRRGWAGAGYAAADGAGDADGDGRERDAGESELGGGDGQRGGDGVPGGAVPGGGVRELRAGGDADGDDGE